jgi:hypothetical protein
MLAGFSRTGSKLFSASSSSTVAVRLPCPCLIHSPVMFQQPRNFQLPNDKCLVQDQDDCSSFESVPILPYKYGLLKAKQAQCRESTIMSITVKLKMQQRTLSGVFRLLSSLGPC